MLAYLVTGGLAVGFFVWRQDLLANIPAHVTEDGVALVVGPMLSASEVFGTYRFTRAFALKYGVVFDFNGEARLLQPAVLAAVGF